MERKLTNGVDGTEITVGGKMGSCGTDVANDWCSWECTTHVETVALLARKAP